MVVGASFDPVRRRGRGPEVRLCRLPAASLPRVPAHLSPVASSPWWCRACAVPIARFFGLLRDCARCLSTSCSRVVDRRFMWRTKVAASRRWLLAFGCVARYYFLATFRGTSRHVAARCGTSRRVAARRGASRHVTASRGVSRRVKASAGVVNNGASRDSLFLTQRCAYAHGCAS